MLRAKARGHRDLVTVIGHAAIISAGEWITASGEWINDRAHGQQFKARFLKTSAPSSIDGIEKYLGSGMIRGIGPVYAKKMVKAFGGTVFDVIEAEPDRLREVTGIGAVRAKRITDAWAEQKVVREIMVFLHSHGVGTARAVRIFKTYGADAVQVMTENPYRLARDIRGIGFKSADAIAMKLGIEKTAMIRLRAGISYALTEAMDEGHCGLPTDQLIPLAEELLEAPKELILTALELERSDGAVIADKVGDTACTFLAGLYRAEQAIADQLIRIVNGRLPWTWIDEKKALPWVEKRSGLQLADSQRAAIRLALMAKALVITGGPGVGKTTIVNSILKILAAKGVRLLLCAPTGRAAKRMTEATGVEAKTIHRLLEVDPKSGGFKPNADNPLDCDLLVVDEASMVDVMLMQALMKATPDNAALLIVGDIDQLPSVGPGQVLADIIGSGAVPVVRLTEVFRQAAASRIITNAHRINQGAMPDLSAPAGESDFYFVPAEDPETAVQRIVELVKTRINAAPIHTEFCSAPFGAGYQVRWHHGAVGSQFDEAEMLLAHRAPQMCFERQGCRLWGAVQQELKHEPVLSKERLVARHAQIQRDQPICREDQRLGLPQQSDERMVRARGDRFDVKVLLETGEAGGRHVRIPGLGLEKLGPHMLQFFLVMKGSRLKESRGLHQTSNLIKLGHQLRRELSEETLGSAFPLDQAQYLESGEQIAGDRSADAIVGRHRHFDDLVAAERHACDKVALDPVPDLLPPASPSNQIQGTNRNI